MTIAVDRRRTYHKRDRLKQLRAFCYATKFESFVQAAAQLGLSPPTVSLHVRQLERELRCVLFERGSAGISLTSAGETAYALAEPLVSEMDGLSDDLMERVDAAVSDRLPVAASPAAAAFLLPAYVKALRERHPGARVRVRSCPVREGVELLRDSDVELVFGARDSYPEQDVEYRELHTYGISLITPANHALAGRSAVSPEEASEWPAIVPLTGTYSRRFETTVAERLGLDGKAAIEAGGWETIKRYVEAGLGIAVLPTICISKYDRVSVIALEGHFPSRSFGVFMNREMTLTPLARRFLQLMIPNPSDTPVSGPI